MYEEGKNYLLCLPFGWVWIGTFVRRLDLHNNLWANGCYVRRAGATWAVFLRDGPNQSTIFEPMAGLTSLTNQTLWVHEWPHALPPAPRSR